MNHSVPSIATPQDTVEFQTVKSKSDLSVVWFLFAVSALSVCTMDWLSKSYARQNLFIFENASYRPWIMIPIIILLCSLVVHMTGSKIAAVGCGMALGGMVGNMAELLYYGAVTDWIPMPGRTYANIADFAVCIVPAVTLAVFVGLYAKHMKRWTLVCGLIAVAAMAMIGTLRLTLIVDRVGHPLFG